MSALQSEYSFRARNLGERIIPVIRGLGIGLVPDCPLGRGFLAGQAKRADEVPTKCRRSADECGDKDPRVILPKWLAPRSMPSSPPAWPDPEHLFGGTDTGPIPC